MFIGVFGVFTGSLDIFA